MSVWNLSLLTLLMVPLLVVLIDAIPAFRASRHRLVEVEPGRSTDDFEVLVPIWGSTRYLENVDFLAEYGRRVVLCTTTAESPDFYIDLDQLAQTHGFRVVRAEVPSAKTGGGNRSVSGTIRDRVVLAGVKTVEATYVVALDADTTTARPLGELVAALEDNGLEMASVRIVPQNTSRLLGRLQSAEYRMAMHLRRLWPWMVSGACHAGTTEAYSKVMERHSKFFQGNDAEVGILADSLGYRVGHVAFDVPTTVPDRALPWWRQRFAWAGGEFRLGIVNVRLARRYPGFYLYLTGVVFLLVPLRWASLVEIPWTLLPVYLSYVALVAVVNRSLSWVSFVFPVYGLLSSLILVVLSPISYLQMALADGNAGIIRPGDESSPEPKEEPLRAAEVAGA